MYDMPNDPLQSPTILPNGFHARPTHFDDADAVAGMLNACSVADAGAPSTHPDELRSDWQQPSLDLATDSVVVAAPDGAVAGYAIIWNGAPYVRPHLSADVHPAYRGQGIGTALCSWGEARAVSALPKAPEGTRVALRQYILSTNEAARALLAAREFALARHYLRMLIELDAPPPEPLVPDGLAIRPLVRHQDEEVLARAVRDGFRDHWGYVESPLEDEVREWNAFMDNTPHFDPGLFLLATDGEQVAGTCCAISQPGEGPEKGWIFALCVLPPWRRRGLAQALLLRSFGELYRRAIWRIGLGVDANNLTGATRLYEKVGMDVERRYEFWEKELRAGTDLATPAAE
jgi:mycothiol synthase